MGSAATVVNTPLILKNVWDNKIEDYFHHEQPFQALVSQNTEWDGLYRLVTVATGGMRVARPSSLMRSLASRRRRTCRCRWPFATTSPRGLSITSSSRCLDRTAARSSVR